MASALVHQEPPAHRLGANGYGVRVVTNKGSPGVVRVRLDLAYDGGGFSGWAVQPGLRTVAGVLSEALTTVLRTQVPVVVAGRTDTGVHARGQVAHIDVPAEAMDRLRAHDGTTGPPVLVRRLSKLLPDDVVLHDAQVAAPGFDARFSPVSRRYAYRVCDTHRDPLTRSFVLWHRGPLDVAAMAASTGPLLGLHDFAAYAKPREGATTIRTLLRFDWQRVHDGPDAGLVVAQVEADAFCHSMVRSLVGACLAVGENRRDPAWPAQLLADGHRSLVAPAHGLTLEHVTYPPDDKLATRATQARARRDLLNPSEPAGAFEQGVQDTG
ncbi:MAG: tRNA pseudouridine(38-40) synthase TruA [Micrococcales bacterium]|nr:tRNA pseudouridine(38-40) synthase TruA [Micrococcales bacterium]MCL2668100.1 tRNA pseudouridine(38-40) synthase TruA [Micrococcales bacterium]